MNPIILFFLLFPLFCFPQSEKFKFYLNYCNTNNLFKYKPSNIYSPENIEVQKYNHNAGFNIQYHLKNNVFIKSGVYNMKLYLKVFYNIDNYPKDLPFDIGFPFRGETRLRYWSIPVLVSLKVIESKHISLYSNLGSIAFIYNYDCDSYRTIYLLHNGNFVGYKNDYYTLNKSKFNNLYYLSGNIQVDYFFLKHLGISAEISYNYCLNKMYYSDEFFKLHSLEFKAGIVLK